jgi:uncharacterized membrane protein YphA (DoxX/SURF4 family)
MNSDGTPSHLLGGDRFAGALGSLCRNQLLVGSQQVVQGVAQVGYPQQLRVLLGIAKLLGGITLIVPGLLTLKEWAYAGFTFAWVAAVVAHYLAKDGAVAFFPLILLVLPFVSYFTRPASRRLGSKAAA